MTIPGRSPSWSEIEEFCKNDQWTFVRSTDHSFWQKVLPSGEQLETHTSFACGKTMSPGRFSAILCNQLKVSRTEFWTCLQTGDPVDRPSEQPEEQVVAHEAWVVLGLKKYKVSEEQISRLAPDDARSLLDQKWAAGPPD